MSILFVERLTIRAFLSGQAHSVPCEPRPGVRSVYLVMKKSGFKRAPAGLYRSAAKTPGNACSIETAKVILPFGDQPMAETMAAISARPSPLRMKTGAPDVPGTAPQS